MKPLIELLIMVASIAFIGVGIYTVVGGWHMFNGADFTSPHRPTGREMFARIPQPIRKIGMISIAVFLGCLLIGVVATLISQMIAPGG